MGKVASPTRTMREGRSSVPDRNRGESGVFYESEKERGKGGSGGGQAQWVEYVGTSDAMSVAWLFRE